MKVILVNGSPHEHGCTRAALDEVAKELTAQGVAHTPRLCRLLRESNRKGVRHVV